MTKSSTTTGNDELPGTGAPTDRSDILVDRQALEVEFNLDGFRLAGRSQTSSGSRFAVAASLTMAVIGGAVAAAAVAVVGHLSGIAPELNYAVAVTALAGVVLAYILLIRTPRSATLVNKRTGQAEAELPVRPLPARRPKRRRPRRRSGRR
ncbi:hypothetical protein [Saccharothrix hoggarensis]|uniref:Superfamily III holin-X n=2 Tax=Saccharothrix hoggarensis TaxID=913853 RepID=A0ABW3QW37_9PSEU